ncbi:hypothetical protein [Orrella sp. 11846]|uniref:hypothetical protein n=1 Tax=Orrella sp. 11846 TaxID=3409913 RepID=UPI003B5B9406
MMKYKRSLAIVVVVVVSLIAFNYFSAYKYVAKAIQTTPRNKGVDVVAYHQWLVNPTTVVFDIREVGGNNSMLDVTRVLLTFASEMKDRSLSRVVLAFKGDQRFYMEGDYFKTLGQEYGIQNPNYTINNMPSNIKNLDGTSAFSTWRGGFLGVLEKQLKDFNEFHEKWWLSDTRKTLK